jgi:integrase/recombinase XerD
MAWWIFRASGTAAGPPVISPKACPREKNFPCSPPLRRSWIRASQKTILRPTACPPGCRAWQQTTRTLWEPGCLKQITFETLIGLLASTGLRIGEALRLTLCDVHLDREPPHLEIRNTKFGKSRFVPVHPSTARNLRLYLAERHAIVGDKPEKLFLLRPSKPLLYPVTQHYFKQITGAVGVPKNQSRRGPAWHSLRHTFAVRRLLGWYRAGLDVRSLLPNLAVYLGHLGLAQTYHYLTATPELLSAAASMFEGYADPGGAQ